MAAKLVAIALAVCLVSSVAFGAQPLVVHEWGTFTALQDEQGRSLGGINVDDEPLPAFVHNLNPFVVGRSFGLDTDTINMKGAPERHPFVTLRLETPVIYFHRPPNSPPLKLDVDVSLRGGWLTQFYPNATPDAPGIRSNTFDFGPITPDTIGRLTWKGLTVGSGTRGPKTDDHVWAAPRNVRADTVAIGEAGNEESEKYLFYRGVGNFAAPLEVVSDAKHDRIELRGRFENVIDRSRRLTLGPLWLVQVLADGRFAYRTLRPIEVSGDSARIVGQAKASFSPQDFAIGNLDNLRTELRQALVREGLYPDEAAALLETWNQAYFRAPGLRLFFLVPRQWTDHYLPLSFSVPVELERAMVGRIELVSPEQRAGLKKLAAMPTSDPTWTWRIKNPKAEKKFLEGHSDFGDLGVKIPPDYQTYLDLGRFRNALLLDEQRHHPSANLARFIAAYGLAGYAVQGFHR
jgi:hypothetical protein